MVDFSAEQTINTPVAATEVNSWPSPFNDERLFSAFLSDCNHLWETTNTMFLPASDWLIHKGYWADDEINGGNSMSIRVDFSPDTKQPHQYAVHFSTVRSGEQRDILHVEYDPVAKAIVLTGP